MFILASRSATVLVIFIIAIIAFCLATVFASMTGPISILPAKNESGGVLDNLSVITDTKEYVNEKFQKIEDSHEKLYKAVFDV